MKPFAYERPKSADIALHGLSSRRRPLAGGTDLLPLLKLDLQEVDALLDIKACGLPGDVREAGNGSLVLGALCTLTDIADSPLIAARHPFLVEAVRLSATEQIRNRATLGGNLLQRPRCAWFRHPRLQCWLKGGDSCLAAEAGADRHAVYGEGICRAVHPSDLAGCLLALDATVVLRGPGGERRLALADFFAAPAAARRRETLLAEDELLFAVEIARRSGDWEGAYRKAMDRQAWDFALAGIALVLRRENGLIADLRVVGNGLAAVPWRLRAAEEALRGSDGGEAALAAAQAALTEGARPLPDSAWKLPLARALLREALESLSGLD